MNDLTMNKSGNDKELQVEHWVVQVDSSKYLLSHQLWYPHRMMDGGMHESEVV
jgi:hypothetical protein